MTEFISNKQIVVCFVIFVFLSAINAQKYHSCSEDKECLTTEICDQLFCCRTCTYYNREERPGRDPESSFCVEGSAVSYCARCLRGCFDSFDTNGSVVEECYCPNAKARLASLNEANDMLDEDVSATTTTESSNDIDATTGYIIGGVVLGLVLVLVVGFVVYEFVIKKRD